MKRCLFAFVFLSTAFSQAAFADFEGEKGHWDKIEKMRKESEASLASLTTLYEVYRQDGTGLEVITEKVKTHNEILGRLHEEYGHARIDEEGWEHFVERHPEHAGRSHWNYFSDIVMANQMAFGHMAGREIDLRRSGWEGFSSAIRDSRFHLGEMAHYNPGCHQTGEETVMCGGEMYKRVGHEGGVARNHEVIKEVEVEERVVENEN